MLIDSSHEESIKYNINLILIDSSHEESIKYNTNLILKINI